MGSLASGSEVKSPSSHTSDSRMLDYPESLAQHAPTAQV